MRRSFHSSVPGFCHDYLGCDFSFGSGVDLAIFSFHRIGTYEFDLVPPDYTPAVPFTTQPIVTTVVCSQSTCTTVFDGQYQVGFNVRELPSAAPPVSAPLAIGLPSFTGPGGTFVSSATPVTLSSLAPEAQGFQYRSHLQGTPPPVYSAALPFPVHWAHVDLPTGSQSVPVFISGSDGPNLLQYSAENFAQLLEPRHAATLILDNTPPVISIAQPQATAYPHNATLTLNYSADDGAGSGVASFMPTMDGAATLPGGLGLQSGQPIKLLTEMTLGAHTFRVSEKDNVNNTGNSSVTFTIIVTADSIKDDVQQFLQTGAIKNGGQANSLLAKLDDAAKKRASGNCKTAANLYEAFINELSAQSGKGVDAAAAAIMIADAQYLIAHCP